MQLRQASEFAVDRINRTPLLKAQFEFQPFALGFSLASYITIDFSNTCRPLFPIRRTQDATRNYASN
jgi:hypothetical protein